jgi:hypothetical protein
MPATKAPPTSGATPPPAPAAYGASPRRSNASLGEPHAHAQSPAEAGRPGVPKARHLKT